MGEEEEGQFLGQTEGIEWLLGRIEVRKAGGRNPGGQSHIRKERVFLSLGSSGGARRIQ